MYWFDTTLLALLAAGALLGAWFGFVAQFARLVCVGASVYAAILFHEPVVLFLQDYALKDAYAEVIEGTAYVVVFVCSYLILHFASRLVREAVREADLEGYDRLLGALLGAGKMAVLLGVICLAMTNYRHEATDKILARSRLAPVFAQNTERIVIMVPEEYKARIKEVILNICDQANIEL